MFWNYFLPEEEKKIGTLEPVKYIMTYFGCKLKLRKKFLEILKVKIGLLIRGHKKLSSNL